MKNIISIGDYRHQIPAREEDIQSVSTTEQLLEKIQKKGTLILSFRKHLTAHMIMIKYKALLEQIEGDDIEEIFDDNESEKK